MKNCIALFIANVVLPTSGSLSLPEWSDDATPKMAISSEHAVFMRFALSEEDLASAAWVPYAISYDAFDISAGGGGQKTVFVEFKDVAGHIQPKHASAKTAWYPPIEQYFRVTPTGQTSCGWGYDCSTVGGFTPECGGSTPLAFCGQDAQYAKATPDRFIISGTNPEIIVTDRLTDLRWQQNLPRGYDWQQAIDYCEGLIYGGHSDWRLPTSHELASIVDYSKGPAIDTVSFPYTPGQRFWTSSLFADNSRYAWIVDFDRGGVTVYDKSLSIMVRCVHSNSTQTNAPISRYVSRPESDGKVVITDSVTSLEWTSQFGSQLDWQMALAHCEGLTYGGHSDWRLPTVNELRSLVDYGKKTPASTFPGMTDAAYWSSSYYGNTRASNHNAWTVTFSQGGVGYGDTSSRGLARCVRP